MTSLFITNNGIDRDLVNSIAADAQVIVLDSDREIQEQITESLQGYTDITNLHIVVSDRDRDKLETQLTQPASSSDRPELLNSLSQLKDTFLENSTISLHTFNSETKAFSLLKQLKVEDLPEVAANQPLNNQPSDAIVSTDKDDYAPGSTAVISGSNFQPGESIELQVLHTDGTPNTGGGHEPWQVTDGGAEDLDGRVDGNFQTTWYVNPDDSANSAFILTATGLNSGEIATHYFTDSAPAVQFFYLPKKETDILTAINAVATNGAFNTTPPPALRSVTSITVSTDNTIIYYDHWENGYESNISNPTQSNTQIWGDNNPSNGIAPGYTVDLLNAGNVIALDNSITASTAGTVIDYDGQDKIGASKAIVVSRAYWPNVADGPRIAEAVNIYDTSKWGLSYKVPLGENFTTPPANSTTPSVNFEYTSLFVTASRNGTNLTITGADTTGDNVADGTITRTLNEGESYFLNGGVLVGTTVTATNPIQAHLLTGDIGSTYASRAYTLVPTDQWGISYYTPVGTEVLGTSSNFYTNTDVFLYNPDASGSITVNYRTQVGPGTVSVPAGTVVRQTLPVDADSGAHFYTTNPNDTFFATTAFDSENAAAPRDWGFSLIPEQNLTPIVQIGWGPGNSDRSANGNPVWIMATAPTTIYVDYDGDGIAPNTDINGTQYDRSFNLGTLQTIQITDTKNNDFDQSGIRVYTVDGTNLAAAWGQDVEADPGGNSLDLGTEVLPLPIANSWKKFALVNDVNLDGNVDPGDTIEFTINIQNDGVTVLGNVNVSDIIPKGTTYISSSTKVNGTSIGDDTSGTAFPFDDDKIFNNIDDGLNIGNIPVGGSASVTFRMLVNNPYDGNLNGITNSAAVDSDQDTLTVAVNVPVDIPTQTKTLYLSGTNDLDRIDPVATSDTTTSTSSSFSVARDDFASGAYNLSTGTRSWDTNWLETNDGTGSATAGNIFITGSQLRLDGSTTAAPSIAREVNLSGLSGAILSFTFSNGAGTDADDSIILEASSNAGSSYTTLETFTGNFGTTAIARSYNLQNYISPDTRIRFRMVDTGDYTDVDEIFYVDNLQIAPSITFNQSISMRSNFEMPSGKPVTVSAYINASSGTPSTSSNIAATLTYDSGTIATLNNPTSVVAQGSSGVYLVTWTGTLGNNVTIPTGQDVSLNITNNQSNLNFTVLSDSNTYPSKIDLATRSVIDITSIGIYDNSYANGGGNLVNAASTGNTVYLRVQAQDPFGDYDITGLAINITNPNSSVTTINPTSVIDVDNTIDGKRIYEYAWTPTGTLGNYTINVTAREGYENTITDTASTTLNLNNGNVPNVTIGDATATEGNLLVFDVSLSTASTSDIILDLTTTPGTATGISDYETGTFEYSTNGGTNWITAGGTNGTQVTIPAGNTNIKVRINSVSDLSDEPNETFTLGVNSVISGSVGNTTDTGTGTITDDDPIPSISISDISLTEGDINSKQFTFNVSLSNPSSQTVTVNYATANATNNAATANSDYTAATGTVSFAPGETTKAITVNVTGDTASESNETFLVNLSNATNATISDPQGIGTILNDDNIALLAINDVSITEGNSGTTTLAFTVTRSGLTTSAVTVNYATANDTATAGNDYVNTSGTLSFASGETSKTISVTINGDTPPEANETFYVNLSNATNATITDSQGIGTILNDDASGTITGRVLADTNNDNTGDSPLSGVTIELLNSGGNSIDSDPNTAGVQPTTTTTNSNGDYTFSNVTPGSYQIKETDPTGYASVSDGDTTDGSDDTPANTSTNDNSIPVTISANETDSGNNFIDEQLGTISGTVLRDTNNDNIGDSSLSDVTLELLDAGGNAIDSNPTTAGIQPTTTTTNASGNYTFSNVAPGTYQVRQTNLAGYQNISDTQGANDNLIANINVTAGGSSTGNSFVDEQLGSISGNVSADTDNNDLGDTNLNNVTLELLDAGGNAIDSNPTTAGVQPTTTTTNASGNYTFSNVAPGTYQVRQTNLAGYQNISDTQGANDNLIANINVTAGGTASSNNFVDEQLGSITGNVSADTDNNDLGDTNLNNVTLELLDAGGNAIDSNSTTAGVQPTTTTTNASGNYTFSNVAPGTYQVRQTNLAGYQNISDTQGANDNLITNINLNAGGNSTGNNFVDEQLGSISGNVSADTDNNDIGDTNLNNVTLELLDAGGNAIDSNPTSAGIQPTTTTTNANGNYTFSNVAPGTYQVRQTNLAGYQNISDTQGANDNLITNINLNAGGNSTGNNFVDEQLGSISGNVSADTDNNNTGDNNVSGVTITLRDSNDTATIATTTTDSNGNYSFTGVAPGSYLLKPTNPAGYISVSDSDATNDGANDSDTNSITNDNTLAVNLTAAESDTGNNFLTEQTGTISGNVSADTDNNNTGDNNVSGVTITLRDSNDTATIATTTTDSNGNYSFTGVAPGSYLLKPTNPAGYISVSDSDATNDGANDSDTNSITNDNTLAVNLTAGESDTGNNFLTEQTGTISGNVKADIDNNNTGDSNVSGVTITLRDSNDTATIATTTTDSNGNYSFTGVAPGSYLLKPTNPAGYISVSDSDATNDGANDSDTNSITNDNTLAVNLTAAESDTGNNFLTEQTGTISGTVQADTDNNNTGDANLSGVAITLRDSNDTVTIATTTTDSNGNYSFTGVAPGSYLLKPTNPAGYISVSDSDATNDGANDSDTNSITNDNTLAVNLTAAESDTGNNFLTEQTGTISGNVSADTDNNNTGDNNVSGVTITLRDSNDTATIATTTTDSNGNYSFTGVAPGSYLLKPTNPAGYISVSDSDATNDGANDSDTNSITNDNTLAVNLTAGETDTGNNFLTEQTGTISGNVSADTDNNNTGDNNVSGVTITLRDSNDTATIATTTTDSNGNYSFTGVAPGSYLLKPTNPAGYISVSDSDATNDGANDSDTNSITNDNTLAVNLTAAESDTGNNFLTEQTGTISGTVQADTDNNNTGDANLSGVAITLRDSNDTVTIATTTTDSNGNYSFTGVAPGSYLLKPTNPAGYISVSDSDATNDGANDSDTNSITNDNTLAVNLTAAETDTGNNFLTEQTGTISGNVSADTDNNNTGDNNVSGVTITLRDSNDTVTIATTTTDSNGNYSFTGVAPGSYLLKPTNPAGYISVSDGDATNDGANDSDTNSITNDNTLAVNLTAAETDTGNNFLTEQTGTISGNVSADTDNNNTGDNNVSGVTITLRDSNDTVTIATTTTDSNGNYSFTGVAPGSYLLKPTNPAGYISVSDSDATNDGANDSDTNSITNDNALAVNLTAAETDTGNNFLTEQTGTISGTVQADTDNNNTGDANLSGVAITLRDSNDTATIATTTTDSNGNYSFTGVAPGSYLLKPTNPAGYISVSDSDATNDGANDSDTNSITNDNTLAVNLTAAESDTGNNFLTEQTGTISGNVSADTDNNNTGDNNVSGVTITLRNSNDTATIATTTTDSNGNYSFTGVAPGSYLLKPTNPAGYISVSDSDATNDGANDSDTNSITNDNTLAVNLTAGETDTGNNFLTEQTGTISGNVSADTDNNDTGDSPLSGVTIELLDSSGNSIDSNPNLAETQPTTTTTAADGSYSFSGIAPGNYQVRQTNLVRYIDVSDTDGGNLNNISINLNTSNNTGNNFVDRFPYGTSSSDTMLGTSSNDFIVGLKGRDTLTGNGGNDTFYYNETSESVDIITDFNSGDRIVLTQILKNEVRGYTGNDPIGAGYVKVANQSAGTMVQIDFDANNDSLNPNGSLNPKDLVFLRGVAANTITSSAFVF